MKKTQNTNSTIDQIIVRAHSLAPSARAEFLRRHSVAEIMQIHERVVGEAKPKTPRPILEKRILAALAEPAPIATPAPESKPIDEAIAESPVAAANAASWDSAMPEPGYVPPAGTGDAATAGDAEVDHNSDTATTDPDVVAGANDADEGAPAAATTASATVDATAGNTGATAAPSPTTAAPAGATRARDPRLPAIGTVLTKADRHGTERARCTIVDGGVEYAGTTYKSISAAAIAAAKDLGLASKTQDGYAFWGLKKGAPRAAKKDAVESLQKAWERYRDHAASAAKVEGADERAKVHAAINEHVAALQALTAPASA